MWDDDGLVGDDITGEVCQPRTEEELDFFNTGVKFHPNYHRPRPLQFTEIWADQDGQKQEGNIYKNVNALNDHEK